MWTGDTLHGPVIGGAKSYLFAFVDKQTLADRERVLGPDHPDTLTSRNNLAYAYVAAGRAAEAIPLHEQTLAALERVLGPDHPYTLGSRDNLAAAYRAAGGAD